MNGAIGTAGEVVRDLGGGLIVRHATAADADRLAAFNAEMHREPDSPEPDRALGIWTRDLLRGHHPTAGPADFTIVEDTASGALASTLCLISQVWSYDGIPFKVGRPELVATAPAYRRRGLVRAQMEIAHAWSAARGELALTITGIPWYYRQFGYEMALAHAARRSGYRPQVPALAPVEAEPYVIRPATEADLPFIARTYEGGMRRYLVSAVRDATLWRHELLGHSPGSVAERALRIIADPAGEPVGLLGHATLLWGAAIVATFYEVRPEVSWLAVTPSVVRYLWATGEAYAAAEARTLDEFTFMLGTEHPAYAVMGDRLPRTHRPYAWYIRVPDLPRFVRHVAPALERRLAASPLAGHSGAITISYYRTGLRLAFAHGRLSAAESFRPQPGARYNATFPDLTFLHLLFGHRSLDDLQDAFADCRTDGPASGALLNALFPTAPSEVWGIA